jgi:hypothetical protein
LKRPGLLTDFGRKRKKVMCNYRRSPISNNRKSQTSNEEWTKPHASLIDGYSVNPPAARDSGKQKRALTWVKNLIFDNSRGVLRTSTLVF